MESIRDMTEKRFGLLKSMYRALSMGGVYLPAFDSSAITIKNLMKASGPAFYQPLTSVLHARRIISRNPLTKSLFVCYFYLFYLVQSITGQFLPWGINLPDLNYVESLLFLFDPDDTLKLRVQSVIPEIYYKYLTKSNKKIKKHFVKRGFSKNDTFLLKKLKGLLHKIDRIRKQVEENEYQYQHIERLFKNVGVLKDDFLKEPNNYVIFDPILTEIENVETAIKNVDILDEKTGLDFLISLGHEFNDSEVRIVRTAYKGMGSEHYLNMDIILNEGHLLQKINKLGLTRTGKEAIRKRKLTLAVIKKLYPQHIDVTENDL